MEEADRRALPAKPPCCGGVDAAAVRCEHDAVIALGGGGADEAAADIGQHPLRLPVVGVAEATAAAGFDAHDIASADHGAVADRRDDALAVAARVDHAAAGAALLAALDAPGP